VVESRLEIAFSHVGPESSPAEFPEREVEAFLAIVPVELHSESASPVSREYGSSLD
jgi:hypothetical protein